MNIQTAISNIGTTRVLGTVKWYNPGKGFGFVVGPGLGADALLHKYTLEAFGMTSIREGTQIGFEYEKASGGLQVTKLVSVDMPAGAVERQRDCENGYVVSEAVPVRVKWFDDTKGYGFVNRLGCSADVFIGRDVLNRSALQMVKTGQALCVVISGQNADQKVHAVKDWMSH